VAVAFALLAIVAARVSAQGENSPPVAVGDYFGSVAEIQCLGPISIVGNDTVADGDTLTLASWTMPTYGDLQFYDGFAVTYCLGSDTIDADTTDSFIYTVTDGVDVSNVATVTVDLVDVPAVNSPPVANDDDFGSIPDGTCASGNVLTNDADPNLDPLSLVGVSYTGSYGTVSTQDFPVLTFCSTSWFVSGIETFTYEISDSVTTDTATVTIDVTADPRNDPPTTEADYAEVVEGECVDIDVLANDSDATNDPMIVASAYHGSSTGTVDVIAGQTVRFCIGVGVVPAGYSVQIDYRAQDDDGFTTEQALVTVLAVPDRRPIARDDVATGQELDCIIIPILDNDEDPDGDPLTVQTNESWFGTATLLEDNTAEFCTVGDAVSADTDIQFTYAAKAGFLRDSATVTITVLHYGDAPIGNEDTATVEEGTCARIQVLANDTDPDGDTVVLTGVNNPPQHGTAETTAADLAAGTVTYCPTDGYTGPDSFDYLTSDGRYVGYDGYVSVEVVEATNSAPVVTASADQAFDEGEARSFALGLFQDDGGASWAVTVDWGDGSAADSFAAPAGAIRDFTHRYEADGDYTATVKLEDEQGLPGSATFAVAVANVAPEIGVGDDQSVSERQSKSFHLPAFSDPGTDDVLWTVDID